MPQVIGYIGSWNPSIVEKMEINLCSTYIIAFGMVNGQGAISPPENIGSFLRLKTLNTRLMLAIGGDTIGEQVWRSVANHYPTQFAQNCLNICRQHGLDGIDIDWEFPDPADRNAFVALHKAVYRAFNPYGLRLTTAVSAGCLRVNNENVYDVPALSNYVDGFNLMTYDFHMDEQWDIGSGVNFNAPQMSTSGDSMDQGIQNFLQKGAPASKLFVGVPFYSRTYKLQYINKTTPGSPFVPGQQGSDPINNKATYAEVS